MGIKVTTLPNQTSVPASINLLGTLRVGGIEKAYIFQGVDIRPSKVTSVNNRLTSLSATLENRISTVSALAAGNATSANISALSSRVTSVNSRVATVSGKNTSVNSRVATVCAKNTSVNNRLTNLSATLENRLSTVSALVGGGYNDAAISARITSVNENTTSALTKIATVSGRVATVSGKNTSVNTRVANVSALFRTSVFLLSGASVNITSIHRNKTVRLNHNAAMRARLIATGWSRNDYVNLIQWGAGQVSVGSAATLRSRASKFQSAGQYGVIAAVLVSANEYVITGDVSA